MPLAAAECPHCGERLAGNASPAPDSDQLRVELARLKAERSRENKLGFAFGVPGLGLQIGGAVIGEALDMPAIGAVLRLLGVVLLIVGIGYVAVYKGRKPAWALLGLIGCIGLIVMLVLKDYKAARIKEIEAALAGGGRPAT